MQTLILNDLFQLIDGNTISAPLYDPATASFSSNRDFVTNAIAEFLQGNFPHIQPYLFILLRIQIEQLVTGLFRFSQNPVSFYGHLRDFIITMNEVSGADNAELYLNDREEELKEKQKADFEAALKIPGMVKPSQLPDEVDMG
jgi:exportin-1